MRRFTFGALLSLLVVSPLPSCSSGGGGGGGDPSPGAAPIATSVAATSITESGATLNGLVNPNGLATQAWFEYGTEPALREKSTAQDVGDGLSARSASASLSGLAPATTYYFRVCAESSGGLAQGQVLSFETASPGAAPAVATVAATAVGASGATLNGSVIPNGLATTAWFERGTDSTLAVHVTTDAQAIGAGMMSQTVTQALTGLTSGTVHYFRIVASNGSGTSRGDILSFLPGAAPAATTLIATSVGETGATLNGIVNPNGLATSAWFEWGTSASLATFATSSTQALTAGTSPQPVAEALSGLSPGTTYYYRVVASSSAGRTSGSIACFTTSSSYVFGVVSTYPADGATGVPLGSAITVTFSREVEPASLVGAISVSSSSGDVPGVVSYNATTKTATFTPAAPLAPLTVHTVTVAAKVKSVDTVRLAAPYIFGFTSGS